MDLLTLQNGITEDIGISTLPAGSYGQIRLMLTDASIVKDGVEQALIVPSGFESGFKIVGGFSVVDGQPATVTIDFDAGSSIHFVPGRGFILKPVIKIVDVTMQHGATSGNGSAQAAGDDRPAGPAAPAAPASDRAGPPRGASGEARGDDGSGAAGASGEIPESGDSDQANSAGAAGSSASRQATEPGAKDAPARGGKGSAGASGDSPG